jgi:catechol 2,3-dioxygenase-like lactoylglutathione lyase family enzyme
MLQDLQMICLSVFVHDMKRSEEFYQKAGFRLIGSAEGVMYYEAGDVLYVVQRAVDLGIQLTDGKRDNSNLIVFHVRDHAKAYENLISRGIKLSKPLRYEVGTTAVFADDDGHRIAIYEPSPASLTWPSGSKMKEVFAGSGGGKLIGSSPMIYVFLFVKDYHRAREFYRDKLGLPIVEEEEEVGVVKYDCGGIMLTTHVEESDPRALPVDDNTRKGIAPVLYVQDMETMRKVLSRRGVVFGALQRRSVMGDLLGFTDPDGHQFYLCEPATSFMQSAAGRRVNSILQKYMQKDELGSDIIV